MSALTIPPKSIAEMEFDAALVRWRRQFPEINEQDALADLWHKGWQNNRTFAALKERELQQLNDQHNVFEHPDQFTGWHVAVCRLHKRGVYQFHITRPNEMLIGYCKQAILTQAIELKLCTKPNGFMFP